MKMNFKRSIATALVVVMIFSLIPFVKILSGSMSTKASAIETVDGSFQYITEFLNNYSADYIDEYGYSNDEECFPVRDVIYPDDMNAQITLYNDSDNDNSLYIHGFFHPSNIDEWFIVRLNIESKDDSMYEIAFFHGYNEYGEKYDDMRICNINPENYNYYDAPIFAKETNDTLMSNYTLALGLLINQSDLLLKNSVGFGLGNLGFTNISDPVPLKISVYSDNIKMYKGQTAEINNTVKYADGKYGIQYQILTPDIISLDDKGNVKALNYGLGKIIVTATDSKVYSASNTCLVSVSPDTEKYFSFLENYIDEYGYTYEDYGPSIDYLEDLDNNDYAESYSISNSPYQYSTQTFTADIQLEDKYVTVEMEFTSHDSADVTVSEYDFEKMIELGQCDEALLDYCFRSINPIAYGIDQDHLLDIEDDEINQLFDTALKGWDKLLSDNIAIGMGNFGFVNLFEPKDEPELILKADAYNINVAANQTKEIEIDVYNAVGTCTYKYENLTPEIIDVKDGVVKGIKTGIGEIQITVTDSDGKIASTRCNVYVGVGIQNSFNTLKDYIDENGTYSYDEEDGELSYISYSNTNDETDGNYSIKNIKYPNEDYGTYLSFESEITTQGKTVYIVTRVDDEEDSFYNTTFEVYDADNYDKNNPDLCLYIIDEDIFVPLMDTDESWTCDDELIKTAFYAAINGWNTMLKNETDVDLKDFGFPESVLDSDEPAVDPDEPTVDPDEPTVDPDEPTVDPDEPTVDSDEPTVESDTPSDTDTPTNSDIPDTSSDTEVKTDIKADNNNDNSYKAFDNSDSDTSPNTSEDIDGIIAAVVTAFVGVTGLIIVKKKEMNDN